MPKITKIQLGMDSDTTFLLTDDAGKSSSGRVQLKNANSSQQRMFETALNSLPEAVRYLIFLKNITFTLKPTISTITLTPATNHIELRSDNFYNVQELTNALLASSLTYSFRELNQDPRPQEWWKETAAYRKRHKVEFVGLSDSLTSNQASSVVLFVEFDNAWHNTGENTGSKVGRSFLRDALQKAEASVRERGIEVKSTVLPQPKHTGKTQQHPSTAADAPQPAQDGAFKKPILISDNLEHKALFDEALNKLPPEVVALMTREGVRFVDAKQAAISRIRKRPALSAECYLDLKALEAFILGHGLLSAKEFQIDPGDLEKARQAYNYQATTKRPQPGDSLPPITDGSRDVTLGAIISNHYLCLLYAKEGKETPPLTPECQKVYDQVMTQVREQLQDVTTSIGSPAENAKLATIKIEGGTAEQREKILQHFHAMPEEEQRLISNLGIVYEIVDDLKNAARILKKEKRIQIDGNGLQLRIHSAASIQALLLGFGLACGYEAEIPRPLLEAAWKNVSDAMLNNVQETRRHAGHPPITRKRFVKMVNAQLSDVTKLGTLLCTSYEARHGINVEVTDAHHRILDLYLTEARQQTQSNTPAHVQSAGVQLRGFDETQRRLFDKAYEQVPERLRKVAEQAGITFEAIEGNANRYTPSTLHIGLSPNAFTQRPEFTESEKIKILAAHLGGYILTCVVQPKIDSELLKKARKEYRHNLLTAVEQHIPGPQERKITPEQLKTLSTHQQQAFAEEILRMIGGKENVLPEILAFVFANESGTSPDLTQYDCAKQVRDVALRQLSQYEAKQATFSAGPEMPVAENLSAEVHGEGGTPEQQENVRAGIALLPEDVRSYLLDKGLKIKISNTNDPEKVAAQAGIGDINSAKRIITLLPGDVVSAEDAAHALQTQGLACLYAPAVPEKMLNAAFLASMQLLDGKTFGHLPSYQRKLLPRVYDSRFKYANVLGTVLHLKLDKESMTPEMARIHDAFTNEVKRHTETKRQSISEKARSFESRTAAQGEKFIVPRLEGGTEAQEKKFREAFESLDSSGALFAGSGVRYQVRQDSAFSAYSPETRTVTIGGKLLDAGDKLRLAGEIYGYSSPLAWTQKIGDKAIADAWAELCHYIASKDNRAASDYRGKVVEKGRFQFPLTVVENIGGRDNRLPEILAYLFEWMEHPNKKMPPRGILDLCLHLEDFNYAEHKKHPVMEEYWEKRHIAGCYFKPEGVTEEPYATPFRFHGPRVATHQALVLTPTGELRPIHEIVLVKNPESLSHLRYALAIFEPEHCKDLHTFKTRLAEERRRFADCRIELPAYKDKHIDIAKTFVAREAEAEQLFEAAQREQGQISRGALTEEDIKKFQRIYQQWPEHERTIMEHRGALFILDGLGTLRGKEDLMADTAGHVLLAPDFLDKQNFQAGLRSYGLVAAMGEKGLPYDDTWKLAEEETRQNWDRLPSEWKQSIPKDRQSLGYITLARYQDPERFRKLLPITEMVHQVEDRHVRNYAHEIRTGQPPAKLEATDTAFTINREALTQPQQQYFEHLNKVVALLGVTPIWFSGEFRIAALEHKKYQVQSIYKKIDAAVRGRIIKTGQNDPYHSPLQRNLSIQAQVPTLSVKTESDLRELNQLSQHVVQAHEVYMPIDKLCFGNYDRTPAEDTTAPPFTIPNENILQLYSSGIRDFSILPFLGVSSNKVEAGKYHCSFKGADFGSLFNTSVYNAALKCARERGIEGAPLDALKAELAAMDKLAPEIFKTAKELGGVSLAAAAPSPVSLPAAIRVEGGTLEQQRLVREELQKIPLAELAFIRDCGVSFEINPKKALNVGGSQRSTIDPNSKTVILGADDLSPRTLFPVVNGYGLCCAARPADLSEAMIDTAYRECTERSIAKVKEGVITNRRAFRKRLLETTPRWSRVGVILADAIVAEHAIPSTYHTLPQSIRDVHETYKRAVAAHHAKQAEEKQTALSAATPSPASLSAAIPVEGSERFMSNVRRKLEDISPEIRQLGERSGVRFVMPDTTEPYDTIDRTRQQVTLGSPLYPERVRYILEANILVCVLQPRITNEVMGNAWRETGQRIITEKNKQILEEFEAGNGYDPDSRHSGLRTFVASVSDPLTRSVIILHHAMYDLAEGKPLGKYQQQFYDTYMQALQQALSSPQFSVAAKQEAPPAPEPTLPTGAAKPAEKAPPTPSEYLLHRETQNVAVKLVDAYKYPKYPKNPIELQHVTMQQRLGGEIVGLTQPTPHEGTKILLLNPAAALDKAFGDALFSNKFMAVAGYAMTPAAKTVEEGKAFQGIVETVRPVQEAIRRVMLEAAGETAPPATVLLAERLRACPGLLVAATGNRKFIDEFRTAHYDIEGKLNENEIERYANDALGRILKPIQAQLDALRQEIAATAAPETPAENGDSPVGVSPAAEPEAPLVSASTQPLVKTVPPLVTAAAVATEISAAGGSTASAAGIPTTPLPPRDKQPKSPPKPEVEKTEPETLYSLFRQERRSQEEYKKAEELALGSVRLLADQWVRSRGCDQLLIRVESTARGYQLRLNFAQSNQPLYSEKGKVESEQVILLRGITHIDDADNIHEALENALYTEYPVTPPITAISNGNGHKSKRAPISNINILIDDYVPEGIIDLDVKKIPLAEDPRALPAPEKDVKTRVDAGVVNSGGMAALVIRTWQASQRSGQRKCRTLTLPLGVKFEAGEEVAARSAYAVELMQKGIFVEEHTRHGIRKGDVIAALKNEFVKIKGGKWFEPEGITVDGYEAPRILGFPNCPELDNYKQQTKLGRPYLYLKNGAYTLSFQLHAKDGEIDDKWHVACGKGINLHTQNLELAQARAHLALDRAVDFFENALNAGQNLDRNGPKAYLPEAHCWKLVAGKTGVNKEAGYVLEGKEGESVSASKALKKVEDKDVNSPSLTWDKAHTYIDYAVGTFADDLATKPVNIQHEGDKTRFTLQLVRATKENMTDVNPYYAGDDLPGEALQFKAEGKRYTAGDELPKVEVTFEISGGLPQERENRIHTFASKVQDSVMDRTGSIYKAYVTAHGGKTEYIQYPQQFNTMTSINEFIGAIHSHGGAFQDISIVPDALNEGMKAQLARQKLPTGRSRMRRNGHGGLPGNEPPSRAIFPHPDGVMWDRMDHPLNVTR